MKKEQSSIKRSPLPPEFATTSHLQDAESIVTELETSIKQGLSSEQVQQNLDRYGANVLSATQPRSAILVFLGYFWSIPVALLTLAAILSVATGSLVDALVIMGVVIINAVLGYVTESKSEKIILSLNNLVNPSAWVIRDSHPIEIDSQGVVVGDILVLKPGSYVAADARLVDCGDRNQNHLSIDESALTGESIPVIKTEQTLTGQDISLAERTNMVYRGTYVTGGQGLGVVVATGQNTEMGQIQSLVGTTNIPTTPLEKQLERTGGQLVLLSSAVCLVVLGLGIFRGYGWLEMLQASIALAVAAVPEGLPTVATITLALGINQMRKQKVLVRRLDAIEALGSVQTICMDKTGTLTANEMSVREIKTPSQQIEIAEKPSFDNSDLELSQLIRVAVLCNESIIKTHGSKEKTVEGSPTEKALMQMAMSANPDISKIQTKYPLIEINHRADGQNYMATVHQLDRSQNLIAVKGNPAEVLALCKYQFKNEGIVTLTEATKKAIAESNRAMTNKALRVLGMAYAELPNNQQITLDNLIWLGLIGITNPIRQGVTELIADFHRGGINTVMLTGDQKNTASAIANQLNLSQGKELKVLDTTQLNNSELIKTNVFARISPADKLQIVRAFQESGKVVAMTGDGINDAPALKAAEVGIAMGKTGTDIAREVADIILEDDNLETAIAAVSQGRTIYNNIKKALHFLLATNLSEIIVMVLANLLGIGQPLNAIQLLWLNLVTDIFPGLALGLEAAEPNVLEVPPRPPESAIIDVADFRRLIWEASVISIGALGAYSYAIANYGIGSHSSTIAFMSLVTAQLLHALSCRSNLPWWKVKLQSNHYLTLALGVSLGLQFMGLILPNLGTLLKITPITGLDALVIAIAACLPLPINEISKKVND